jgi:sarcosine oxidase subunit beta
MPFALLKYGLRRRYPKRRDIPARPDLKPAYDVAVIGGGGHGLATAWHLAQDWGIRRVAVLEKGYLAGGNTARNTTIIRANYVSPHSVRFYAESMALYRTLSETLDFNILYSERGQLTFAHTDPEIRTCRLRAEVNRHCGVASELIGPDEIRRVCPVVDPDRPRQAPILGALYHLPGAIARHDAVAWAYAAAAARLGVELHPQTTVTGITTENGRITGVETTRGRIACPVVVQAVAGASSQIAAMAGVQLPIRTIPLQACVSTPLKSFLHPVLSSNRLHLYVSQSARGELVMGAANDPAALFAPRSTLEFKEALIGHLLELFPFLGSVTLMRQWAGLTDLTPDSCPILGPSDVAGHYLSAGWGTWGFKAIPVGGRRLAEAVATGRVPELIAPFALARFHDLALINEGGSSAVGH